jgi:hypothetical protein
VAADQAQFAKGKQFLAAAHDAAVHHAVVPGARCRIKTEGHQIAIRTSGSQTAHIVAIEDHHAIALKDPRLAGCIIIHPLIAIEMVLADVEHGGHIGIQGISRFELETRQFQDPDFRQIVAVDGRHQGVQRRRADVAGNRRPQTGGTTQGAGQGCRRGLAVAAGNGNQARLRRAVANGPDKQFDLGNHRDRSRDGVLDQRFLHRYAWRNGDQFDAGKSFRRERAGQHRHFGQRGTQRIDLRRATAAIGNANAGALAHQPPGHRQPALPEAEDEGRLSPQVHVSAASRLTGRPAPA